LQAGAATYVLKNTASDDLIRVVREVQEGGRPIPTDIAVQLATRTNRAPLTNREIRVVELMAEGLRNKEIAAVLGITEDTAEVHVRSIFPKLDVKDRTAAVMVALRRGIIHLR
jgi:DNA-binding NarL/FixJ family response regulator